MFRKNSQDQMIASLNRLLEDPQERALIEKIIQAFNSRYDLERKMAKELGTADIIDQMTGRLVNAFGRLSNLKNKKILDIACGSNFSKLPASAHFTNLLGGMPTDKNQGYTALFEPWFCRILFELGAEPVGVDIGDLEHELFEHYPVDLGKAGALDFLPAHSFDGIQDSRLFGSPEFTTQFTKPADHYKIAREINRQEQRLLKNDGIIIHSDAIELLR